MTSKRIAKVEDSRLREYELVLIISPEVEGEAVDVEVDKLSQSITGKGGIVADVERWGKRKLAYPIRHFMEGSYVLARFSLRPASCKDLEANLKLSEEVIRYLLINLS